MIPPETFEPLQLKGEIMDMEFTIDTDHRYVPFNSTLSHLTCRLINRSPLYSRSWPKIGREGGIGLLKAALTVIHPSERWVTLSRSAYEGCSSRLLTSAIENVLASGVSSWDW